MREDMIGCEVVEKATGKRLGRLAAWGTWTLEDGVEPCAVVVGDGGAVFSYGLPGLRLAMPPTSEPAEVEKLREEVATLRARNVELSDQLAQHASDRPRWPTWDELPEEDRGAAKELLGEALGPCNWFETGRYKTPVGDAYPDHDAVLDRTEDSAPELQRILTEFLRGLAESETGR